MRHLPVAIYFICAAMAFTQSPPVPTLIKAGHILNVETGTYLSDQGLLIDGQTIKEIGPFMQVQRHASSRAKFLDLSTAIVLPGLIDVHTHLLSNYAGPIGHDERNLLLTVARLSVAERALLGSKLAREDLEAGITLVRDLGNSGINGDVALRDAIDKGWVTGPRMIVSTRALSPPGGQFGPLQRGATSLVEQEYVPVTTTDEARRAVQQAKYAGADCIKVIVQSELQPDVLAAIVREAHGLKMKVAAHATSTGSTKLAADAGVDSIEHAYHIDDEVLKTMARKQIYMVPTDLSLELWQSIEKTTAQATGRQFDAKAARQQAILQMGPFQDRLKRARMLGVPIAAGSDAYYEYPGKTRGEVSAAVLQAYAEEGMPPLEIIQAATINAATLLGLRQSTGSLEPGKWADLIAVTENPLENVSALQHVRFVMKGGLVIKNEFGPTLSESQSTHPDQESVHGARIGTSR